MTQTKLTIKKHMSTVSITNGYWFYFQYEGVEIAVHNSWLGKETVYINDNPVSEKRSFLNSSSKHQFRHNGKEYEVEITTTSYLRFAIECRLMVDGQLQSRQNKAYIIEKLTTRDWFFKVIPFFIIGWILGSLVANWVMNLFLG